ncbi:beta-lactamase-like protein [Coniochaeta sp. 2T2.1]|nr:beta-lactamase-like protein [Coniochaeta sp. 2T2.1]
MLCYLDVVSTPTVDTPGACLRLAFDQRHYIFGNVSEGTQRIMASKRMSMAKVEDIFLSGPVDWHANGGLLGFLLTIADVHETIAGALREANREKKAKGKKTDAVTTVDHVNIHGAKNLAHMLATARKFVFRKAFPLVPWEIRDDPRVNTPDADKPDWEDENIRVWYVPVVSDKAEAPEAAAAAQPSKSKKRKAEQMSDSDGETAPAAAQPQQSDIGANESGSTPTTSQDDVDQEMRLDVVQKMFNSRAAWNRNRPVALFNGQSVRRLEEMKLGKVPLWAQDLFCEVDGVVQRYMGPLDPNATVLVPVDMKASEVPHLLPVGKSQMSICYIVKVHKGKGKFNVAKAMELGVKKQEFKLLVDGTTVLGKDGIEVTPEMVLSPVPEPSGFALVEVPDASYIDSLLSRPEWKNERIMAGLAAMYWIIRDAEILHDERVQSFMREHAEVKHTILSKSEGSSPCLIQNSAVERTRLNMVENDLFPSVSHTDGDGSIAQQQDATLPYELTLAGAQLRIAPRVAHLKDNLVSPPKEEEIMEKFLSDPEILRLATEAKTKVSDPAFLSAMAASTADLPNPDAEIVPLGTGSALPSRSRNVSCTLVRVPGVGSYLLDCGENSLGQLRRMYGYAGADEVLRDLKAIWISHSHADHHLGTISVLKRFSEVVPLSPSNHPEEQQKVAVIAHPYYHRFLAEYAQLEPIGLDTHAFLISSEPGAAPPSPANGFSKEVKNPMDDPAILSPFGLSRIAMCAVDHCDDARAVAFTLTSGLKIAYSGDCRPSRAFASDAVGGDAHLLIHEATLDDELQKDAVLKKHCTTSEALWVAKEMRAKNVLLTHFSQRYPKLPEIQNGGERGDGEAPVVFAFDFMRVRLGEFRKAREFVPALQRLRQEKKAAVVDGADGKVDTIVEEMVEEVVQEVEAEVMAKKTTDV